VCFQPKTEKKTKTKIQFWLKTKIAKTIKNVIFDAKNQKKLASL